MYRNPDQLSRGAGYNREGEDTPALRNIIVRVSSVMIEVSPDALSLCPLVQLLNALVADKVNSI